MRTREQKLEAAKVRHIAAAAAMDEATVRDHLKEVPGWREMPIEEAARHVQGSVVRFMQLFRQRARSRRG